MSADGNASVSAAAPVAALETLPYLQRSCTTIIRVATRLPSALAASRNSVSLSETIREIALSIAAADRLFTGFVYETLHAAGVSDVSSFLPLDQLLRALQTEVPAERAGKLLPPGGLVSILYHLEGQLAEVDAGLLALCPDSREEPTSKGLPRLQPQLTFSFLWSLLAALLALPFVRWFAAVAAALCGPCTWPLRRWRRGATHARLRQASDQLTCLVRIWTVAHGTIPMRSAGTALAASDSLRSQHRPLPSWASTGSSDALASSALHHGRAPSGSSSGSGTGTGAGGVVRRVSFADADAAVAAEQALALQAAASPAAAPTELIRRARSYCTLVALPSRHDFEPGSKAVARRLLESASLPRGAAVWPTRTWRNAALKWALDLMYASTAEPAHLLHPDPVTGAQPGLLRLLRFGASSLLRAAYFAACPLQASEAAGRALQAPSIPLLTWLWRATDMPIMRRLAISKAKARGLAVCQEAWVGGVHTILMCRDSSAVLDAAIASVAQPGDLPLSHVDAGAGAVRSGLAFGTTLSAAADARRLGAAGGGGTASATFEAEEAASSVRRTLDIATEPQAGAASLAEAEFDESLTNGTSAARHRRHHGRVQRKTRPPGSDDAADDPAADLGSVAASGVAPPSAVSRPRLPRALMHINGGGFVGRSFAPDVDMLAEWAMTAPTPTLDHHHHAGPGVQAGAAGPLLVAYPRYSLSPEVTFPTALLELVRVYLWLRERCETVVVSGESAGGNLAAALSIYCLWHGLQTPDALVLAYPALVLNPSPSPSRVSAICGCFVCLLASVLLARLTAPTSVTELASCSPLRLLLLLRVCRRCTSMTRSCPPHSSWPWAAATLATATRRRGKSYHRCQSLLALRRHRHHHRPRQLQPPLAAVEAATVAVLAAAPSRHCRAAARAPAQSATACRLTAASARSCTRATPATPTSRASPALSCWQGAWTLFWTTLSTSTCGCGGRACPGTCASTATCRTASSTSRTWCRGRGRRGTACAASSTSASACSSTATEPRVGL